MFCFCFFFPPRDWLLSLSAKIRIGRNMCKAAKGKKKSSITIGVLYRNQCCQKTCCCHLSNTILLLQNRKNVLSYWCLSLLHTEHSAGSRAKQAEACFLLLWLCLKNPKTAGQYADDGLRRTQEKHLLELVPAYTGHIGCLWHFFFSYKAAWYNL